MHGKAIQRAGRYSFVSCSDETLESGSTDLTHYDMVDLICGADAKTFSASMREALASYCRQGGCLLVSGSKWGTNLQKDDFGKNVLKCTYGGRFSNLSSAPVKGAGTSFRIQGGANESIYAVPSMECVMPVEGAYSAFAYTNGNYGSGTVYRGEDYRTLCWDSLWNVWRIQTFALTSCRLLYKPCCPKNGGRASHKKGM